MKISHILNYLSVFMTSNLERAFYGLGYTVATYPWWTIIISSFLCTSSTLGMLLFHKTTDYEVLWAPSNTNALKNKVWVENNFPKDVRYENLILRGDNVLTSEYVQYLFKIDEGIRAVTVPKFNNLTYEDLCFPHPFLMVCMYKSILQLWSDPKTKKPDKTKIFNLTDADILKDINNAYNDTNPQTEISSLLSNLLWEDNLIVSAEAGFSVWIMKNKASKEYIQGEFPHDEVAEEWESNFIKFLTKKGNQQPDIEDPPFKAVVYPFADRSFQDEIIVSVQEGFPLFAGGFVLILLYMVFVISDFTPVRQRILLSMAGIIAIIMSIGSSFGCSFYFGVVYADLHPVIPFLLLGIGVDNIFIIMKSSENLNDEERLLPLKDRVGLVVKHSGLSITVTSMTDIIAFFISSSTVIPLLRSFCISVSMGVIFLYIFATTFFIACFTLDERRIEDNKIFYCSKSRYSKYSPKKNASFMLKIFTDYYTIYLLKTPFKIIALILTAIPLGFSIYGVVTIPQDYEAKWYMRQTSYQVKFIDAKEELYPNIGDKVEVFVGNIAYWDNLRQMYQIDEVIRNSQYVKNNSHSFWFYDVMNICKASSFDCSKEREFKKAMGAMIMGPDINVRIKFKDIKLNISILNNPEAFQNLFWHIEASRSSFEYTRLPNSTIEIKAMDDIVMGLEKIKFKDPNFESPIARSLVYHQWTANKVISRELVRNLSLTFASISVIILLLVANIQISLLALISVVFTICNVAGFAYYIGLTIEILTSLELILSVGLALDYSAHISVAYACLKTGTRQEKSKKALSSMGPAVFNGGFSTFLAFSFLFNSDSYIFKTFCQMFGLGVLFGLFHALVFLPVILSWLGPSSPSPEITEKLHRNKSIHPVPKKPFTTGQMKESPKAPDHTFSINKKPNKITKF